MAIVEADISITGQYPGLGQGGEILHAWTGRRTHLVCYDAVSARSARQLVIATASQIPQASNRFDTRQQPLMLQRRPVYL